MVSSTRSHIFLPLFPSLITFFSLRASSGREIIRGFIFYFPIPSILRNSRFIKLFIPFPPYASFPTLFSRLPLRIISLRSSLSPLLTPSSLHSVISGPPIHFLELSSLVFDLLFLRLPHQSCLRLFPDRVYSFSSPSPFIPSNSFPGLRQRDLKNKKKKN